MSVAETAQLAVRISLQDGLTGGVNKALGSVGRLQKGLGQTGKGIGQVGAGLLRMGAVAATAAAGGLAAAVNWAGDFQAQLNTINTIAMETPKGLQAIGDGIRQIARTQGVSFEDLTSSYYDLLSAGIKVADAQTILNQAVTLGIGALGTTNETVDLLTTAINAYGLDAAGATKATDMFAQAVADGKVKVSEISATFANVASVAKTAGIGIDEIAAAYGYLTAQGVPAAEVTTEMNRAILDLIKPSSKLQELQKRTGLDFAKIARDKGIVQSLERMREAAAKAGVPFQDLFGRLEGYKFALQTTGPAFAKYIEEQKRINDSAGEAARQAAERQQGFNYQLAILKNNVQDAGITIGTQLLPPLAKLAQKASDFLRRSDVQARLKDLGTTIGKAIDGIDWDRLMSEAETFAGVLKDGLVVAKGLFDLLGKLPDQVKALGLGALVANKASGGLLGQGVGNIFGGLTSAITGAIATKLPGGLGAAFVQKVWVVNMPMGGLGGGGGIPGAGGAAGGGLLATAKNVAGAAIVTAAVVAAVNEIAISKDNKERISQQLNDPHNGYGPRTAAQMAAARALIGNTTPGRVQSDNQQALAAQAQIQSLAAFRASERASQTMLSKQDTTNSLLAQVRDRRERAANVYVSTIVNTSVSLSAFQKSARISSRVARSTALQAS